MQSNDPKRLLQAQYAAHLQLTYSPPTAHLQLTAHLQSTYSPPTVQPQLTYSSRTVQLQFSLIPNGSVCLVHAFVHTQQSCRQICTAL